MHTTFLESRPPTWTQGALVTGAQRVLYVSGQVPERPGGTPPDSFEAQCRLAWANVLSVLRDADLAVENLVNITVFLSDRQYCDANARIWRGVLGGHRPALTIIIAGIYDDAWLLEIEAIAAA